MCKVFSKANKATNEMDVMKHFMKMAQNLGTPMSRLISTHAGYISSTDTQMPQGVPENFLYINAATDRFVSLGEEKRVFGEASYKKLHTDLIENEKEWMEVSFTNYSLSPFEQVSDKFIINCSSLATHPIKATLAILHWYLKS